MFLEVPWDKTEVILAWLNSVEFFSPHEEQFFLLFFLAESKLPHMASCDVTTVYQAFAITSQAQGEVIEGI